MTMSKKIKYGLAVWFFALSFALGLAGAEADGPNKFLGGGEVGFVFYLFMGLCAAFAICLVLLGYLESPHRYREGDLFD